MLQKCKYKQTDRQTDRQQTDRKKTTGQNNNNNINIHVYNFYQTSVAESTLTKHAKNEEDKNIRKRDKVSWSLSNPHQ